MDAKLTCGVFVGLTLKTKTFTKTYKIQKDFFFQNIRSLNVFVFFCTHPETKVFVDEENRDFENAELADVTFCCFPTQMGRERDLAILPLTKLFSIDKVVYINNQKH